MSESTTKSNAHAFDFYVGSWNITNRRLKRRWVSSNDWSTFTSTSVSRPLLGGVGNEDQFRADGIVGMTLRLYQHARDEWSLYWVNASDGVLQPPVVGRFMNGRGEFFGDDVDAGKPIRVRFTWSDITATTARWDQAFSLDAGKTWETNWIMEMTRTEAL